MFTCQAGMILATCPGTVNEHPRGAAMAGTAGQVLQYRESFTGDFTSVEYLSRHVLTTDQPLRKTNSSCTPPEHNRY